MATMPATIGLRESEQRRRKKQRSQQRKAAKLSRLHKPEGMSLEELADRAAQAVRPGAAVCHVNVGDHPFFSEFQVTNPQNNNSYRVVIRGRQPGDNFCSCPDFATNTLGTCKHIEFTLGYLERKRGGKTALHDGFQPAYSEVYLQYGARREVRFRPGSDCPVELARLAGDYFGAEGLLQPEAFAQFETFLAEAARFEHDLRCHDDVLAFVAEVRDAERRRATPRGGVSPRPGQCGFQQAVARPSLRLPAQGALFAVRAGRCLLGDEMGLGKTIQAIAAAEIMAQLFGVERVLVVCPTSLKHQWEREVMRFVDRSIQVIGGLRPRREQLFAAESFYKVINYDTVHRDLDLIAGWSPDLVILDEAQRIKNWNTRAARSVKKIASPYAIVLTGTPLENRLEELVSIVQFVDRYRLGPTFRLLHDHQIRDEVGKVVGYRELDRIGKTLAPILLRRQKDQVLDQLPGAARQEFLRADDAAAEAAPRGEPRDRGPHRRQMAALSLPVRSRPAAADDRPAEHAHGLRHVYLLDRQSDSGVKADELVTLLEEVFERPETKVVVFSQWLRMHELLVRRIEQRGWDHVLFHGGVPGRTARSWSIASATTRRAGCSWRPMRAASA